jgi:hypothetical protein
MAISSDLQAAQDEYGSSASPYASLSDYLMQRPAYDRGAREAPPAPSMRTLEAIMPDTDQLLAEQYEKIMAEQRAAEEASTAARQSEIDSLKELLRQELSTSEDAALGQRSELTKALEGQIEDMRRGLDAETLDLRQAGLDERAALARQIEEGDKLVREAQVQAIGDLEDRQGSLVGDLKERIGVLSEDLTQVNQTIDEKYLQLDQDQQASAQLAQDEITSLNDQLKTIEQSINEENLAQSEALRAETGSLLAGLEGKISGVTGQLSELPIPELQQQIAALSTNNTALAQQIDELSGQQASGTADLSTRIEGVSSDLAAINERIDSEILSLDQASQESALAAQIEIDDLNAQLESLYSDVETGNVDQSELLRGEVSELIAGLESRIGGIQENLGALPIDQIQAELATVNDQTVAFQQAIATAGTERTDLAARIEALQAAGLTQDDLSGLSESIAGQRQTDITSALDPIQQQIEALRGQIPGEVDTEALRKQITEDIMAQMANQAPPAGVDTGGGSTGGGSTGGGFSGTPIDNFMGGNVPLPDTINIVGPMGGFVPGAGQTYDAGMDYGPSASEAAGMNMGGGSSMGGGNQSIYGQGGSASADFYGNAPVGSMGGGNQSIVDNSGYLDFYDQQTLNPVSPVKTGNMPGGGVGSGYVKTGAPAYSQSGFLAGEIPPDGSFSGPFQVTQAPALQAAPKFSSTGSRRRR